MARSFNGTSDIIDLGNSSSVFNTASISVSAWFNVTSVPASDYWTIISKRDAGGAYFFLGFTSGISQVLYIAGGSGGPSFSGSSASANTWTHIALTFTGGNLVGYFNGVFDGSGSGGSIGGDTTNNVHIGNDNPVSGRYFPGKIADVAIWNVALTALEIAALAKGVRPNAIRPPSRTGYWPLDGLQSPEPDLSGNKNNGTLTGTTLAFGPPITFYTPRWPQFNFLPAAPAFTLMPQIVT